MKKIFLLLCIVLTFFVGCQSTSVDYFADDEDVQQSETGAAEKSPVKMIRIDDELYYDTGRVTDSAVGTFMAKSFICRNDDEYEVPQENENSNFYDADYYQYRVKINAVEVLLKDTWHIFKKIVSEQDVLTYKYCMMLEDRMPNAKSDSKFLVLANEENISFDDAVNVFNGFDISEKDIYVLPIDDEAERKSDEAAEKERLVFTDEMVNNYKYFLGEKEYFFDDAEYEFDGVKLKIKSVKICPYQKYKYVDSVMYVIKFKYDVENASRASVKYKFDHEPSWSQTNESKEKIVVNENFGGDYGCVLSYATLNPGEKRTDCVVPYFASHDNKGNHLFYIDDIININAPVGINGRSYEMLFEIDTLK